MNTTDRAALGRAAQLARGCHWAFGALGDPYAMLLCGHDDDPWRYYARIREAGPVFRGRTGDHVVTGHAEAEQVLDDPAFTRDNDDAPAWAEPFEAAVEDPVRLPEPDELVPDYTALLPGPGQRGDLLRDVAREGALRAALAVLGLPAEEIERLREPSLAARVVADARLSPQPLLTIEDAAVAWDTLGRRALLGDGVEMAANAVCRAILAVQHHGFTERLAEDPALPDRVAAEVSRFDPPVHLERRIAREDRMLAGQRIAAGEHVVVAVAAANRDPAVFDEPDRFDPDRTGGAARLSADRGRPSDLDAFTLLQITAALRAAAPVLPRLRLPGPVRSRRRSPVLRGLSRCPVVHPSQH